MSMMDTGGPAFPFNWETKGEFWAMGMTLRDYFAAKAMHGWLSTYPTDHSPVEVYEDGVAEFAYRMADAMLKARNNQGDTK